ncbi:AAA family ATPase [Candidatus Woesearchaeota archaeon]|nr:AAA family ATPase [Candidatus Woesearchaeota archaeon]
MYGYSSYANQMQEEGNILRETINQLRNELERYKRPPLMLCEVREASGHNAVIKVPNGNQFFVEVSSTCEPLKSGDHVFVDQKNLMVVRKARSVKRHNVEKFVIIEKPQVNWKEIGGMAEQISEIKEVIELPLLNPDLFKEVGIEPPKGILLHGPPGTGKTLLAKAVAASTKSTFIEIVGSELVQKFIGEGAKMVKDVFSLAREKSPSIIFIDELDSIAAKRIELGTSGEREVQRTFMQLLAEIDGFKALGNVKIIGCTNRKDILDPAILRPGRLERQIPVPLPDRTGRKEIFEIHAGKMNTKEMNTEKIIELSEGFSGADIKAVCTEAGYFAIRQGRSKVTFEDFLNAVSKIRRMTEIEEKNYMHMFG